jgi:alpha-L-fucosidase
VAGSFADVKRNPFTGEDFRFTTKGDALYAIALAWPDNGKLVVKSLAATGPELLRSSKPVQLLGYKGKLDWKQTEEGLCVQLPPKAPCDYAVTLKIPAANFTSRK